MYIKTYSKGCPLCNGDVKGNSKEGYLCLTCFVKFKADELNLSRELTGINTDNKRIKTRLGHLIKK